MHLRIGDGEANGREKKIVGIYIKTKLVAFYDFTFSFLRSWHCSVVC